MTFSELALASLNDRRLFTFLDLTGTFAFAFSGAVAARNRGLGVLVIALASRRAVLRLAHPVVLFDLIGLGLFAVTGAQKALAFRQNAEVAILLGMVTAVSGGVIRDVLPNWVPVILRREIYASAALFAAAIEVAGDRLGWMSSARIWVALAVCFALLYLLVHFQWHLPRKGADPAGRLIRIRNQSDHCVASPCRTTALSAASRFVLAWVANPYDRPLLRRRP